MSLNGKTAVITGIGLGVTHMGHSPGALNAAALKVGSVEGDRQTARDNPDWILAQMGAQDDLRMPDRMVAIQPAPGMVSKLIELSVATRLVPTPQVLFESKDADRAVAGHFLTGCKDRVGQEAIIDVGRMFG